MPKAGKPAFTLRGVVDYQWRRGKTVLQSGARPTSTGHMSLAGADPAGFSSASCLIGWNSRGSLVMMPSTPDGAQAVDHASVVDGPHVELSSALPRPP